MKSIKKIALLSILFVSIFPINSFADNEKEDPQTSPVHQEEIR
ncbi:hypothetical protein [Virgibacillus sp. DJP39]